MYRMVYRQEGGLSNLNPYDYMRQEVDKSLAKFKQRSSNVAQQARPRPAALAASMPNQTGITSLIPDTVKTLTTMPETLFKSYLGDDNIRRTPGMDRNLEDIIKKQNAGLEGIINYSDYGFPDLVEEAKRDNLPQRNIDDLQNSPGTLAIPTTRKQFMDIINAGPDAISNALTLGRLGYTTDPTTGKVSFTSGEFNFPTEGTILEPMGNFIDKGGIEGWVNRIRAGIPGSGGMLNEDTQKPINIQPENVYNPNTVAALQYGDIEAQAEADRLRQEQTPGVTITDSRHPDYALFNQEQRTSYDEASLRRKGYSEQDINRLHQEGRIDTAINSVDPFVSIADSRHPEYTLYNYAPQLEYEQWLSSQPTGFEGTGYGQFSPQVTAPTQQANAFEPTNINLLQNYYQGQQ